MGCLYSSLDRPEGEDDGDGVYNGDGVDNDDADDIGDGVDDGDGADNGDGVDNGDDVDTAQGCISCGILVSGIRARGVSSEHMENMEMFSCSPT